MNRLFWILTFARFFSELADWFNYMVQLTIIDDYQYISLMIAIRNIVPFIISPSIGNYVEKNKMIPIIIGSQTLILISNVFIYIAYFYTENWYVVYVYVLIQSVCNCLKTSSYQYIVPDIIPSTMLEQSNKIQAMSQSLVYIFGMGIGGIVYSLSGGITNIIVDNVVSLISVIIMLYFSHLMKYDMLTTHTVVQLDNLETVSKQIEPKTDVTFWNGMLYLRENVSYLIILMVNAITYYIYGIAEIINYKLGFDHYGILMLSLVLGLSTTGTIILYFYRPNNYICNYLILIISIMLYGVVENYHFISIWFIALWLFTYTHYAFQIMMTTMIQKDADPNYKGRLFTYYYGLTNVMYALGSFTGSFLHPWYWIPIIIMLVFAGCLLIWFRYIQTPESQRLFV